MTDVIWDNYAHGIDYSKSALPKKKKKPSIQAQTINSRNNVNGNVKMDCEVISIS